MLGINSVLCCCVRIVSFHYGSHYWAVFGEKSTRPGEHVFGKIWMAVSIRVRTRNDILYSTHNSMHAHIPLLLAKTGLAHSLSFFSNHLPSLFLSFALIQSFCLCCQHNSSYFAILFLLPQLHKYTHPHPQRSPPGCCSNSVGREHHPCFTPLCNHTPILFLPPLQSHFVHPTHPIPTALHLQVAYSSWPIRIVGLYVTAGGMKLLSNNEGKKERS